MEWLAFVGSILGGLIGGLFTFIGVKLTIKHNKEKERKDTIAKAYEERPRLEIEKSTNDLINEFLTDYADCNVLLLNIERDVDNESARLSYKDREIDINNLQCVEYILKNTGYTEIEDICVISNRPGYIAVVELEQKDFFLKDNLINYDAWSNKRYIKPGESISLRFYYGKDLLISTMLSYPLTIWLIDVNGSYWEQGLDFDNKKIEISQLASRKKFMDMVYNRCYKYPF